ncbi:MAG: hypothetical protein BWY38_03081 [Ignavibacteria bacterium ADurb.Bin266]|nr:MAG: hypothetical protein BWY38_03081 [Ignavibacteria bacterium ADurb.Bin266]
MNIEEKKPIRFEDIENKDCFVTTSYLSGTNSALSTEYGVFFIARFPCEIIAVSEVHSTAGTNAGSVNVNIEKLTGTEALDSGLEVLVSPFDLKGTINTVSNKSGVDLQNTKLKPGDRLALKDSGTLTSVAGVCITIYMKYLNMGNYRVNNSIIS